VCGCAAYPNSLYVHVCHGLQTTRSAVVDVRVWVVPVLAHFPSGALIMDGTGSRMQVYYYGSECSVVYPLGDRMVLGSA